MDEPIIEETEELKETDSPIIKPKQLLLLPVIIVGAVAILASSTFLFYNPGITSGIIFGCTVLNKGVKKELPAKLMTRITNNRKIFSNLEDGLNELKEELSKRFDSVKIKMVGCMALFSAQ